MSRALDWHDARERAAAAAPEPSTERVALAEALGRILAEPLVTPIPLPHFASSAMDGWAVRGPAPWRLLAGPVDGLAEGEAVDILTGGLVPEGTDGVLRVEAGRVSGGRLEPVGDVGRHDVEGHRHIRRAGSEAVAGERLLEAGVVLTPPRIALAAAGGADDLPVRRRPRIAVVLTGDEVVETGRPAAGRVRDSFRVALPEALRVLGGDVVAVHRVGDDERGTRAALTADDADLVVTTGGTGRSSADHLRDALAALGAEVLIPSVAIRPGGPTLLARAADRIVLGLPGNPLAAVLGLVALGAPLLAAWTGTAPRSVRVDLAEAVAGRGHATALVPATLSAGRATPVAHTGSGMLRGLAAADAVLVVPSGGIAAGDAVEALPLPWQA